MIYNSPEDKKTSTSCLCVLGWAGLRTDYTVSSLTTQSQAGSPTANIPAMPPGSACLTT